MQVALKSWAPIVVTAAGMLFSQTTAIAMDPAWKAEQLADALSAAPPAVTDTATIYAWTEDGKRVLIREGSGPYNCVASGMTSLRVGKKALPFPDSACMDQNAWAWFQAVWAEKNPRKPSKPFPTEPGMTWMLAGMGVPGGMVKMDTGNAEEHVITKDGKKISQLSPHIMIIPLPMANKEADMAGVYDPGSPEASWIMFPQTTLEHLMVHFSPADTKSMMQPE